MAGSFNSFKTFNKKINFHIKCYWFNRYNLSTFGIPEKRDPEPLEDPEPYRDPELYDDSIPYEDPGPHDDPGKTQELINSLNFLDFLIMSLILWKLQWKADLLIIAECR